MNVTVISDNVDKVPVSAPTIEQLIEMFLSGRNAKTLEAYRQDLDDFRRFIGRPNLIEAARAILSSGHGAANGQALAYRAHLLERKLAPATVNRRLAALRSLVSLAGVLGLAPWRLDVKNLRAETYRDTRGPGRRLFNRVLFGIGRRSDPKSLRDRALLRLFHDLGLRRGEVGSLDREHLDLEKNTLMILGKGRASREPFSLPPETKAALVAWLEVRGEISGSLFRNFDHAKKGHRLTDSSLYRIVRGYGLGRPHGLRHLAITEALDRTGGDVRAVARFSRHRDLRILNLYDDNRTDLAGHVARLVASSAGSENGDNVLNVTL